MGLTCFKSWKHDGTGHKGNRDVLASPGSYFFLSNSCGQGEEWLKSLNKGVWIPFTETFLDFRADRKLRMREVKRAVGRTGSYLSHSTYRKIKRVLSFKPRVFGQRLEETVLYERRYGVHLVPLVVVQCVSFIRERGLHEVGLFRQSGQATMVKELQEAFDAGERPSFDSTDVHTVASLLKLYLRQLPEPLVPYNKYQDFLSCGKKIGSDRTQGLVELRSLLHNLPVANFNLLHYICQFLNEVQSYSSSNKMSCHNLATVFGPNILRAKTEDPHSIIGGASVVQLLMLELIREHQSLFCEPHPSSHTLDGPHTSPNVPRPPRLHPSPCSRQLSLPLITERRGRMGSVSSPRDNGSPSPQAQSSADHHSHSRIAATAESSKSFGRKRALGHRYTSSQPENWFYPLASTSYSAPQHLPDGASACHAGLSSFAPVCSHSPSTTLQRDDPPSDRSQARPGLLTWADTRLGQAEESTACIWSSSTAMGEGGESVVQGTASRGSSDAKEDSTPSVYDNLDRVSLHERHLETVAGDEETEGREVEVPTADSDSSWSSCEMLPLDHSSCHGNGTSPFLSATTSPRFSLNQGSEGGHDDDNYNEDDNDDNDVNKEEYDVIRPPNSPASCSMPSDAPLSTGSSEVFLPSGPPELQGSQPQSDSQDVNSLLAELQKQMARQKAEYQARINRLERCNESLQGQVAVLRVTLDQQKRWHSVAEIKIRNVERARADADRRNATLQREMEQFFRMFGEISGAGEKKGERSVQSF